MGQTSLSVWFVCRLCRGSFGQVDAFIEHKKQKHFTQFQNTTSIVFEERELRSSHMYPIITSNGDHQISEEIQEPLIKIEMTDGDPIIPFSSEFNEEPSLNLVQPKSELITFTSEINTDNENNLLDVKPPEQNPYVLLKRLTSEEIQRACVPQHSNKVKKCTENLRTAPVQYLSREPDLHFECKLCSKQLESDAQLKNHVGICALHHKDQSRFCVPCNRMFCETKTLKRHHLRFHGTEEEKMSLFKFKCHVCSKPFRHSAPLSLHLETHKKKKEKKVSTSKSKRLKCSHPNCEKEFPDNSKLQIHVVTVHLGMRAFSCDFPNCNKKFKERGHLNVHLRIHTGERPFKCTSDNCGKTFRTFGDRSLHHRGVHCGL